jgi:hypothetical protein
MIEGSGAGAGSIPLTSGSGSGSATLISRGPTFRYFVNIRTEASMQDVTVERLQEYRLPSPPSFKCNVWYCVRVSLSTVKIFLAQHSREGGCGKSLFISGGDHHFVGIDGGGGGGRVQW